MECANVAEDFAGCVCVCVWRVASVGGLFVWRVRMLQRILLGGCMFFFLCLCMCVRMCVCVYVHVCVCVCVFVYVWRVVSVERLFVGRARMLPTSLLGVCVCMYVCVFVCMYVLMYLYECMLLYVCLYIYAYIQL